MTVLECRGLRKAYRRNKFVLDDFNIQDMLGGNFKPGDLEKLTGFLNKYNN